jgi:hypothetical protein
MEGGDEDQERGSWMTRKMIRGRLELKVGE